MQILRGLSGLRRVNTPCVATIGNFDGVHCGHQAILRQVKELALHKNLPTVAITFEPKPMEFFKPDSAPARLMRANEQSHILQHCVDFLLILPFNSHVANMSALDFIEQVLHPLSVTVLVQGADFRFGKNRLGDNDVLRNNGFNVIEPLTVRAHGVRVSSTAVRCAITQGDFTTAKQLLGRPYSTIGRIIHGKKLGRQLGYPTANIAMRRLKSPVHGVYVVDVLGITDAALPGVASVGTRPVVNGKECLLEVFLFDFDQDIYGRRVEVRYLKKIRDELDFNSLSELTVQIEKDCQIAREYFNE